MAKRNSILKKIKVNSFQNLENETLLAKYVKECLGKNKTITFFDWECPPRFLDVSKDGEVFVNYDINLKQVFKGKRFDALTELPRAVENKKQEISNIKFLNSLSIPYRYVKIIADTNAYYLTSRSLDIMGRAVVQAKFREFQKKLIKAVRGYPSKVEVYLMTKLMKPYKQLYQEGFDACKNSLNSGKFNFVTKAVLQQQLKRTKDHMGFVDAKIIRQFSINTIATYAAEGLVFNELSKQDNFSNCVWLNIREFDRRSIAITNCLRRNRGLGDLPMVFLAAK